MKRNIIRETKKKYILPLNEYKAGNLNRATKAFLDSLSLNTKQRMFPKEFLYKLINSNMTNKEKVTALIALKDLPKGVREKVFGTMTSYSNKITSNANRNTYYNRVLQSPSINNKRITYMNTANAAKKRVSDIVLFGATDREIKMIKNNKKFTNAELDILKIGYFKMPELNELKKLKKESKTNKIFVYKKLFNLMNNIIKKFHIMKKYIKKYNTSNNIILDYVYKMIMQFEYNTKIYANPDINDSTFLFTYYLFDNNNINLNIKNKVSYLDFYTLNTNYVKNIFNKSKL